MSESQSDEPALLSTKSVSLGKTRYQRNQDAKKFKDSGRLDAKLAN